MAKVYKKSDLKTKNTMSWIEPGIPGLKVALINSGVACRWSWATKIQHSDTGGSGLESVSKNTHTYSNLCSGWENTRL